MKKILKSTMIFIYLIVMINVFSPSFKCEEIKSNILYVCGFGEGNYSSIQDAINNSENGTIIYVNDGVYYENLLINKSIRIKTLP